MVCKVNNFKQQEVPRFESTGRPCASLYGFSLCMRLPPINQYQQCECLFVIISQPCDRQATCLIPAGTVSSTDPYKDKWLREWMDGSLFIKKESDKGLQLSTRPQF